MAFEQPYENKYKVESYKDVMNLAWQWRSYWQISKRMMIDGFHWYHKEIPIVTPKQVEAHVPSTAATLVNDAADHLAGSDPTFQVKTKKESQKADEDRQRVQSGLNAAFDLIGRKAGHPLHRTLAIHGGWSGMMVCSLGIRDGWNMKDPNIRDLRWKAEDPRFVFPDPGSGGGDAVIIWRHSTVGLIRQQWPDWNGHLFSSATNNQFYRSPYTDNAGGYIDNRHRLNKALDDNAIVDWIEYWDGKYKCFIANGTPVFQADYGEDLIEHGLGCMPFVIRQSGYGDANGEPQHKYVSMLAQVFSELETEASLITQLKWIVQETAWPVWLAPKDTEGEFDLEPGSLNFIENPDSIKAIRALREDAIKPESIIQLLGYIKDEIERATYPVILKGQAPSGIRAGYPIAILSTQAKLKFASPSEALQETFKQLAEKTLTVIKTRVKKPMEVMDGVMLRPEDLDTYEGRIQVKLEPQLPQDLASKLPLIEFLLGSAGFSKADAIRELGYEHVEEIRQLRMAEDLEDDPRVKQVMVEHLIGLLSPEAAAAVDQVAGPNQEIQQISQKVQEMQAQMQEMQTAMQLQQTQQAFQQGQQQGQQEAQQQPQIPGLPAPQVQGHPGAPQAMNQPMQGMPQPSGLPMVPGQAGGTQGGQNLAAPGMTGSARAQVNPDTALPIQARQLRALQEIQSMGATTQAFGNPSAGVA